MKWEKNFDDDYYFLGYVCYIKKLNFTIYIDQNYKDYNPYFKLYVYDFENSNLMDTDKEYENVDEAKSDGVKFLKKYLKNIIKKLDKVE